MTQKIFIKIIIFFTLFVTIAILGLILWDYYHDGVPTHHLLNKKDLPGISNWWGAILLPLATYLSLNRIKKRINFETDSNSQNLKKQFLIPFVISFFYAIIIAVSFSTGNSQISNLFFPAIFIIALFFPIYKSEYFLGFIIGLTYTFGGVLPIVIGLFLAIIGFLLFKGIRPIFIMLGTKIGVIKNNNE
jgi:hypothetical protein